MLFPLDISSHVMSPRRLLTLGYSLAQSDSLCSDLRDLAPPCGSRWEEDLISLLPPAPHRDSLLRWVKSGRETPPFALPMQEILKAFADLAKFPVAILSGAKTFRISDIVFPAGKPEPLSTLSPSHVLQWLNSPRIVMGQASYPKLFATFLPHEIGADIYCQLLRRRLAGKSSAIAASLNALSSQIDAALLPARDTSEALWIDVGSLTLPALPADKTPHLPWFGDMWTSSANLVRGALEHLASSDLVHYFPSASHRLDRQLCPLIPHHGVGCVRIIPSPHSGFSDILDVMPQILEIPSESLFALFLCSDSPTLEVSINPILLRVSDPAPFMDLWLLLLITDPEVSFDSCLWTGEQSLARSKLLALADFLLNSGATWKGDLPSELFESTLDYIAQASPAITEFFGDPVDVDRNTPSRSITDAGFHALLSFLSPLPFLSGTVLHTGDCETSLHVCSVGLNLPISPLALTQWLTGSRLVVCSGRLRRAGFVSADVAAEVLRCLELASSRFWQNLLPGFTSLSSSSGKAAPPPSKSSNKRSSAGDGTSSTSKPPAAASASSPPSAGGAGDGDDPPPNPEKSLPVDGTPEQITMEVAVDEEKTTDPPPSAVRTVGEEKSPDPNIPSPISDLLPLAWNSYKTLIAKDIYKRGSQKECYELATECSAEAMAHPIATILAGKSLTDTVARVVIDIVASDDCLFVAEETIGQDPSPIFTELSPHILAPRCADSAVKMSPHSHFPELCAAFRLIHRQITGPIDQRTLEDWVASIAPRFDSPEPFHLQIRLYLEEARCWISSPAFAKTEGPPRRLSLDPFPGWLFVHTLMPHDAEVITGILASKQIYLRSKGLLWAESVRNMSPTSFPALSPRELAHYDRSDGLLLVYTEHGWLACQLKSTAHRSLHKLITQNLSKLLTAGIDELPHLRPSRKTTGPAFRASSVSAAPILLPQLNSLCAVVPMTDKSHGKLHISLHLTQVTLPIFSAAISTSQPGSLRWASDLMCMRATFHYAEQALLPILGDFASIRAFHHIKEHHRRRTDASPILYHKNPSDLSVLRRQLRSLLAQPDDSLGLDDPLRQDALSLTTSLNRQLGPEGNFLSPSGAPFGYCPLSECILKIDKLAFLDPPTSQMPSISVWTDDGRSGAISWYVTESTTASYTPEGLLSPPSLLEIFAKASVILGSPDAARGRPVFRICRQRLSCTHELEAALSDILQQALDILRTCQAADEALSPSSASSVSAITEIDADEASETTPKKLRLADSTDPAAHQDDTPAPSPSLMDSILRLTTVWNIHTTTMVVSGIPVSFSAQELADNIEDLLTFHRLPIDVPKLMSDLLLDEEDVWSGRSYLYNIQRSPTLTGLTDSDDDTGSFTVHLTDACCFGDVFQPSERRFLRVLGTTGALHALDDTRKYYPLLYFNPAETAHLPFLTDNESLIFTVRGGTGVDATDTFLQSHLLRLSEILGLGPISIHAEPIRRVFKAGTLRDLKAVQVPRFCTEIVFMIRLMCERAGWRRICEEAYDRIRHWCRVPASPWSAEADGVLGQCPALWAVQDDIAFELYAPFYSQFQDKFRSIYGFPHFIRGKPKEVSLVSLPSPGNDESPLSLREFLTALDSLGVQLAHINCAYTFPPIRHHQPGGNYPDKPYCSSSAHHQVVLSWAGGTPRVLPHRISHPVSHVVIPLVVSSEPTRHFPGFWNAGDQKSPKYLLNGFLRRLFAEYDKHTPPLPRTGIPSTLRSLQYSKGTRVSVSEGAKQSRSSGSRRKTSSGQSRPSSSQALVHTTPTMVSRLFPSSESQVVRSSPASAGGGAALDLSLLSSSLTAIAGQLTDIQAKLSRQDDAMQRQQAEIEELKKLSVKK